MLSIASRGSAHNGVGSARGDALGVGAGPRGAALGRGLLRARRHTRPIAEETSSFWTEPLAIA